jgi:hypothetical protein
MLFGSVEGTGSVLVAVSKALKTGALGEVGSRNHLPRSRPGLGDVDETIVDVTSKLREAMWMPMERAGPRCPAVRGV